MPGVCVFLLSISFGTVYENFFTNAAHLLTCAVSELNMYDSTRSYPQVKREDLGKYFKGGGGGGVGVTREGKGGGRHTLILRASDTSHCLHRYNSTLITVWFIDSPKVEKTGLQLGRGIPPSSSPKWFHPRTFYDKYRLQKNFFIAQHCSLWISN